MNGPDRLILTGLVGSIVAAICCFTPILVITLGAIGLAAVVGYLDVVLLPLLGIFVVLLITGLILRGREKGR